VNTAIHRPGDPEPGSPRIFAQSPAVLAAWNKLVDAVGAEEMALCFDDLSERPYPEYPDPHHGPVRDLEQWVAPPAWERRVAGGSYVVFYRATETGVQVVYADRRAW